MTPHQEFKRHMNTCYGEQYTSAVFRFQEGFEADCGLDGQAAFDLAVDVCGKFINVFKDQSERTKS